MSDESLGNEDYIKKSRFSELEIPKFESTIPSSLLEDKDESDKILYNSINIQSQQLTWLIKAAKQNNDQLRITNGRVNVIEKWKERLTSGWGLIGAIITIVGSIGGLIALGIKLFSG